MIITTTVSARAKDLTKGVFSKGSRVDIDIVDMVAYHKGLEWKVVRISEFEYALRDEKTIFTV